MTYVNRYLPIVLVGIVHLSPSLFGAACTSPSLVKIPCTDALVVSRPDGTRNFDRVVVSHAWFFQNFAASRNATLWSGVSDPGHTQQPMTVQSPADVDGVPGFEGPITLTTRSLRDIGTYHYLVDSHNGGWEVTGTDVNGDPIVQFVVRPTQTMAFSFSFANAPPTATMNPGGHFHVGDLISFNTQANDPDGGTLAFVNWQIVTRPPGSLATMANAQSIAPTMFIGSKKDIGAWAFTLRLADNEGEQKDFSTNFTVDNRPPTLTLSGATSINVLTDIRLEADPATDQDGETITWVWDIIAAPANSTHQPQSNFKTGKTLIMPTDPKDIGQWTFRCTATDEHNASVDRSVTVMVKAVPPEIVIAQRTPIIRLGDSIHVETTQLNDAYGDPLTSFSWDILQVPIGAGIGLVNRYNTTASLSIPASQAKAGTWIFKLTVTDQVGQTAEAKVKVLVDADPIAQIVGPSQTGNLTLPLDLDGSSSNDPDSPPTPPDYAHLHSGPPEISPGLVRYQWRLLQAPENVNSSRYHPGPVSDVFHVGDTQPLLHIPPTQIPAGDWLFELEVTDGEGNTATEQIWVQVLDEGLPPLALLSPPAYYTTTVTGLTPVDIAIAGDASFDMDNLLMGSYTPGLGITNYSWDVFSPGSCFPPPAPPAGATARTATLYAAGSLVPPWCLGVHNVMLTVTDDDTPAKVGVRSTQVMIGNCASAICLDYPTQVAPQRVTFSDQTDVMMYYHLNSLLYNNAAFAAGLRLRMDVYHESNLMTPVYNKAWDVDLLPSDIGGVLAVHWSGFDNLGRRPLPGKYSTTLQLLDANQNPTGYSAVELQNIWIQTLDVHISTTTDSFVNHRLLSARTERLNIIYQVTGQDPNTQGYDQLRYRIFRPGAYFPLLEATPLGPYTNTTGWDGRLPNGDIVEPGSYELELEIYKAGASLGRSARHSFTIYQARFKALGVDPDVQNSSGVFVTGSENPTAVSAANFNELKFQMRPIAVEFQPKIDGLRMELTYDAGTVNNLGLFLDTVAGSSVTLPKRWSALDFSADTLSVRMLAYGKHLGSVRLKLVIRSSGTVLLDESVLFRVGVFPGAVGVPIPGQYPYFRVVRTVNTGSAVNVALDPTRHAERFGRPAALYVVAHKTPAEWAANPSLVDVAGGSKPFVSGSGSIHNAISTAWAAATAGAYDVVYDFGAMIDTVPFVTDGRLDPGDILDSPAGAPSVTVEPSFTAMGAQPVTFSSYGMLTPSTFTVPIAFDSLPKDTDFRLRGQLVYPRALGASHPLVVFAHGNHTPRQTKEMGVWVTVDSDMTSDENFRGYSYLQEHLASRGFVTLSVDLDECSGSGGYPTVPYPGIKVRSWIMLKNIEKLLTDPTLAAGALAGKIDTSRIYFVGHSRGGEAVIVALDQLSNIAKRPGGAALGGGLNAAGIRGIVSLSPVTSAISAGGIDAPNVPFLLLYGSSDGDVFGADPNAAPFRHYDRATRDKFAVRVIGGNHNHFNTSWGYSDASQSLSGFSLTSLSLVPLVPTVGDPLSLVSGPDQRDVAKGYLTAFFQWLQSGDDAARTYFLEPAARLRPLGVRPTLPLHIQARLVTGVTTTVLDHYETQPATGTASSLGVVVSSASHLSEGSLMDPDLGVEIEANNRFFQETKGALMDWTVPAEYVEAFPVPQDLREAKVISFRVAQQPKHVNTVALGGTMTLEVELEDVSGHKSAVSSSILDTIPEIYESRLDLGAPLNVWPITSAGFQTFRLPVAAFVADGRDIDLKHVKQIRWKLGAPGSPQGRVAIDDLEVER